MAVMPVILTWTEPQTIGKNGPTIWRYSAKEIQPWNFLQLNYHTSWDIKTPIPVTLVRTLVQTVATKLLVACAAFLRKPKTCGNARHCCAANRRELHRKGVGSNLIDGVPSISRGRLGVFEGPATPDTSKKQNVLRQNNSNRLTRVLNTWRRTDGRCYFPRR